MPFTPTLETKGISESKYFKNELHGYGANIYFILVSFF
jgi:hypothetical protein